jgi:hypothetical protein
MDKLELSPKITHELVKKINRGYCPYCKRKCDVKINKKDGYKFFTHFDWFPNGQYRSWFWSAKI